MLAAIMVVRYVEDAVVASLSPSGLPNQPVNMNVKSPIRMMVTP